MKAKRMLSLLLVIVFCLSSMTAWAADDPTEEIFVVSAPEQNTIDRVSALYNDEMIEFDVDPVIENGRILVPFRAIFETMGCAVYYSVDENGKQVVSARRGSDNLLLTIGETEMYCNGKTIVLDVPAKIKNGRTLVPARAISEALEYDVLWDGDSRTVSISARKEHYTVHTETLTETITDEDGTVLVEAVAYYLCLKTRTIFRFSIP